MIKVNLLEGAADTRAATRATKAAAKTTQQLLMVVGALLTLFIALAADYYISQSQLERAEAELKQQQEISVKLQADRKRKEDLEKQIKSVEDRIKIIDDLQKTQRGPSAMLSVINSKRPPTLRMEKIVQKGDTITITGEADNEAIVSEFVRGLELGSNNLFQSINFNVSRGTREEVNPEDPESTQLVTTFKFNVNGKYTPTQVGQPAQQAEGGAPGAGAAPAPQGGGN